MTECPFSLETCHSPSFTKRPQTCSKKKFALLLPKIMILILYHILCRTNDIFWGTKWAQIHTLHFKADVYAYFQLLNKGFKATQLSLHTFWLYGQYYSTTPTHTSRIKQYCCIKHNCFIQVGYIALTKENCLYFTQCNSNQSQHYSVYIGVIIH